MRSRVSPVRVFVFIISVFKFRCPVSVGVLLLRGTPMDSKYREKNAIAQHLLLMYFLIGKLSEKKAKNPSHKFKIEFTIPCYGAIMG